MKPYLLIFVINVALFTFAEAQFIAEDAKGKSTILYKTSNINFDVTETALSFNWNNLRSLAINKPNAFIVGLTTYGKNSEGLGPLLDDGDFVPESRLTGIIGLKTKTIFKDFRAENALDKKIQALQNDTRLTGFNKLITFKASFESQMKGSTLPGYRKKSLTAVVNKIISKHRGIYEPIKTSIDSLQDVYSKGLLKEFAKELDTFSKQIQKDYQTYTDNIAEIQKKENEIDSLYSEYFDLSDKTKARSFIIYLSGGTGSKQFQLYNAAEVADLNKHFKKKTYRSDFIDLVMNYDVGSRWILGASFGYERANNFDSLTKKEYTVRTTTTQGDQQMIAEKKYESYTGDFRFYDRVNIKTDILYFARAGKAKGKSKDYRIVWNVLYTRMYLSQNTDVANKVIHFGTGLNFFKKEGKFVGGFYLEEKDAFNGNDVTDSDFWKRLSFGLIGKYSFQSILDKLD